MTGVTKSVMNCDTTVPDEAGRARPGLREAAGQGREQRQTLRLGLLLGGARVEARRRDRRQPVEALLEGRELGLGVEIVLERHHARDDGRDARDRFESARSERHLQLGGGDLLHLRLQVHPGPCDRS
jgi:hypothetical protein